MAKYKLDYIWLDGYSPVQNLRTKCQLKDFDSFPTVEELPMWGFDGSSTLQAEGGSSDCMLKPVAVYPDIENEFAALVLCEVMNPDGTPHETNMRATIPDDPGTWFGFEQEYFLMEDGKSKKAADDIWMARFLLLRIAEKYELDIEWHCKPLKGDWNGSGMHANFSTEFMRETGGKDYFDKLMAQFEKNCAEHIAAYGPDNHLRLTGLHETQSIDMFSWGVADRGASIRVPHSFEQAGWKGYIEDRRPNSQGNPYAIASRIIQTIQEVAY